MFKYIQACYVYADDINQHEAWEGKMQTLMQRIKKLQSMMERSIKKQNDESKRLINEINTAVARQVELSLDTVMDKKIL